MRNDPIKQSEHWADIALKRLKTVMLEHPLYAQAGDDLLANIASRKNGECILVTGPSRVGKSELLKRMTLTMNNPITQPLKGCMPVVMVKVRNQDSGGLFSTKGFNLDLLQAMKHPFYSTNGKSMSQGQAQLLRKITHSTNMELARAAENGLKSLGTKFLVIDEVQHLEHILGGRKGALAMMDSFKTLAENLDIVLILVGAYPVLNVVELSPHMLGRLDVMEMPRYRADCRKNLESFQLVLDHFSEGIRFPNGVNGLVEWNAELYQNSLGVVGLLSNWLRGALSKAARDQSDVLTVDHLVKSRLPRMLLEKVWNEILSGEEYLSEEQLSFEAMNEVAESASNSKSTATKKGKKSKGEYFQTKLKRRGLGDRN